VSFPSLIYILGIPNIPDSPFFFSIQAKNGTVARFLNPRVGPRLGTLYGIDGDGRSLRNYTLLILDLAEQKDTYNIPKE